MDDFLIIIYILAAVAYFLLMQWRKAFKGGGEAEEEQDRPRGPHQQQPQRPVTSFEDILRELQPKAERAKQEGKAVFEQAKERAKETAQQVMPPLAPAAQKTNREYKTYEDVAPKALSWEKPAEAREAAKKAKFRRDQDFKAYEKVAVPVNKYAELLRNPSTARDAVILSEIFNRKYS